MGGSFVFDGLDDCMQFSSAMFYFGGFYNVAATDQEPGPVSWALIHTRQAAMDRHGDDTPPASLDDPPTVQAGARAFAERGCLNCHGGPGAQWAKFFEGLNPGPPDLKDGVADQQPRELFWVIKNGIKMTGMPIFAKFA